MTDQAVDDRLVDGGVRRWGRLAARPAAVNPLDEAAGTPYAPRASHAPRAARALRRLRLKEWVGWTFAHPEVWSSLIVQEANYLASTECYVHEAATGALHQHAAHARGGTVRPPERLYGGSVAFARHGADVAYDFAEEGGRHRVRFGFPATGGAAEVSGELTLDGAAACPPLSVSSPLPGGAMYTHKLAFPAEGVLRVGTREYVFDPARDLALLDEHRTFLPYRTRWVWGTFAHRVAPGPEGVVGANFARRPVVPGSAEESCLWVPGAVEPLSDIAFTRHGTGALAPWHMASRDGRLDVVFTPAGSKAVRQRLLVAAIDYVQWYGTYAGTVRGAEGTYAVREARGVCETMRARL